MVLFFTRNMNMRGSLILMGTKFFLRTELVFKQDYMTYNEDIAKAFNMSCYMIKQSLFHPEVTQYLNSAFNHTAKLRFKIHSQVPVPYYHKTVGDVNFVTNGHNYWFCHRPDLIKEYALYVILDYFNGKIAELNLQIGSKVTEEINSDSSFEDIHNYLISHLEQGPPIKVWQIGEEIRENMKFKDEFLDHIYGQKDQFTSCCPDRYFSPRRL